MSERVLVTGGFGFIGSAFLRRLLDQGRDVRNADLLTYAGDPRRLDGRSAETLRIDVADPAFVEEVSRLGPSLIVHFAAETHVTRSEGAPDLFFRTNVEGTENVLAAAERIGARLVHVSTDEVYGPCLGDPFREGDKEPEEGLATSAYARSKAVADDLVLARRNRVDVVVVRPTNCFGPWQHPEKAVPRWITRALSHRRLPVWGDGRQIRDWMHVEDAVAGIDLLCSDGRSGEAYNLAPEGGAVSNLEMARSIARACGAGEAAVYLTEYDRPLHDVRYAVHSSKLRDLGWHPRHTLESGLAATVEWYRENTHWWEELVGDAEALYADEAERTGAA